MELSQNAAQAGSLGLSVLTLFFRSPSFHEILKSYVTRIHTDAHQLSALQNVAVLTSVYSISSASALNNCVYYFVEAGGTRRFWTCDVPSWHWSQEREFICPVEDVEELHSAVARGAYLRWICPLSPRFLMEVAPRHAGGEEVRHRVADDTDVAKLNHLVLSRTRRVRVIPME
jgi:hypothetical protein